MVTIYTSVSGSCYLGNVPYRNDSNEKPRIFVAHLPSYLAGELEGIWVDTTQTVDEMSNQIDHFLSQWPKEAQSYLIDHYQGFYGLQIEFQEALEDIQPQAVLIAQHGELGAKLIAHYQEHLHPQEVEMYGTTPVEAAKAAIQNRYQGVYKNKSDYATQFRNALCSAMPEKRQRFIDDEDFEDTIFNYYSYALELNGKTHIFLENLGDPYFKQCLDDFLEVGTLSMSIA